jgi:hypothetical protein
MYSVVFGVNHPRLCEDISYKNYIFYDIGENRVDTILLENLMKEVLDNKSNNDIVKVFEEFFISRAISESDDNIFYKKILTFFIEYNNLYNGNKTSAVRCFLVKRDIDLNKVLNVINSWNTYRQKEDKKSNKPISSKMY